MKMKKWIGMLCACTIALSVQGIATATANAAVEENKFVCITDFYGVNKNRDWWDQGSNSIVADGSKVLYSENNRYMTVEYVANGDGYLWGIDNVQIPKEDRDWSNAKYIVCEVKNLYSTDCNGYNIIVSTVDNDNNAFEKEGEIYYLKNAKGEVTSNSVVDGLVIPASFEGSVVIPVEVYEEMDFSKMIRISFRFFGGNSKLRLGRVGYATSEAFLTNAEVTVVDNTVYELPQITPFQKAPPRPSTEPATAEENRYE